MQLMTFKRDHVKISLAFVFLVAFVTHNFYGKKKKRFIVGYNFIYLINVRNIYHSFFKIASTHQQHPVSCVNLKKKLLVKIENTKTCEHLCCQLLNRLQTTVSYCTQSWHFGFASSRGGP